MTSPPPSPPLPEDIAAFIQSGLSITVAGRNDRLVPSLAKAAGCRVSEDRRQVTLLVSALAAETVARDIAHNRLIAVVFSQPSTHRTLQLKGRDACSVPAQPADVGLVRRHVLLFAGEIAPLGWDREFVESLFWHEPEDLLAIRFTPEGAFVGTPGPDAGRTLPLAPGG